VIPELSKISDFFINYRKVALETNKNDVTEAMEWLLCHAEDVEMPAAAPPPATPPPASAQEVKQESVEPVRAEAGVSGETDVETGAEPAAEETEEPPLEAKALKCEECGKLFRTPDEANFHAIKTQHSQFSETTEEKKPLTEEEKAEQMRLVQEKLKQRRLERERKETEEALIRERNRIKQGREMTEGRRKLEELEMKKIADERKREKLDEEKLARQRVVDQIAADREARRQKEQKVSEVVPKPVTAVPVSSSPGEKKVYDQTRLQVIHHKIRKLSITLKQNNSLDI
jgi:hypothetical protein